MAGDGKMCDSRGKRDDDMIIYEYESVFGPSTCTDYTFCGSSFVPGVRYLCAKLQGCAYHLITAFLDICDIVGICPVIKYLIP